MPGKDFILPCLSSYPPWWIVQAIRTDSTSACFMSISFAPLYVKPVLKELTVSAHMASMQTRFTVDSPTSPSFFSILIVLTLCFFLVPISRCCLYNDNTWGASGRVPCSIPSFALSPTCTLFRVFTFVFARPLHTSLSQLFMHTRLIGRELRTIAARTPEHRVCSHIYNASSRSP